MAIGKEWSADWVDHFEQSAQRWSGQALGTRTHAFFPTVPSVIQHLQVLPFFCDPWPSLTVQCQFVLIRIGCECLSSHKLLPLTSEWLCILVASFPPVPGVHPCLEAPPTKNVNKPFPLSSQLQRIPVSELSLADLFSGWPILGHYRIVLPTLWGWVSCEGESCITRDTQFMKTL